MKKRILATILALVLALSLLPTAALAGEAGTIKVNGDNTGYATLEEAVSAATEAVDGVLTYTITGTVNTTSTGQWISFIKSGLSGVTTVRFVGEGEDAELCVSNSQSILGVQGIDVEVSFENLTLSHPDGKWVDDLGNTTKYFGCMVRNSGHTVTYTNCTFPNGACNNMYGETIFNGCAFTSTTDWSLWHTSEGTSKLNDCTFTGKRGVKLYTEGNYGTVGSVELKDTTFDLSDAGKAAVEITKPGSVSMDNVSVSGTTAGAIKMNLTDGYGSLEKATVAATGSKISGEFTARVEENEAGENTAVEDFGITAGEFTVLEGSTLEDLKDFLAPGTSLGEDGTVAKLPVAKVGEEEFSSLTDAFAALTAESHTLTLLNESAWTYSNVYWKAGSQSGSADTLRAAVEAAYAVEKNITIICKPNATITKSSPHIDVLGDITVFANGADFGGNDLSIGTYKPATNLETTVNVYDAKNLVVWGQPEVGRADIWNVSFVACKNDGSNFLMYRGSETATAKINLTMTGCTASGFSDSIVHTTADGSSVIKNCKFSNNCAPVNVAHKQAGTMTVAVEDCAFENCGTTNTTNDLNQYAAPVRVVNNSETGSVSATVDNTTFAGTVGNNGDILLGDGRTGKASHDVTLTVTDTDANVQAQRPGYYAKDGSVASEGKKAEKTVTAEAGLPATALSELCPLVEVNLDEFIKLVEQAGYNFDGTLASGEKLTVKWSPVSGCFDTRAGHTCTVGGVKATGNTPARENSKLAQFQVFDGQTDVTIKNVNFVYVAADFTVCANSNWAGSRTADEVKTAQLFLLNSGNTTVEGCSFDNVVFTSWQNTGKTTIKDSEFKNIYDSYAIKDLGGSSAEVSDCTFENCGGGIMLDSNKLDSNSTNRKDVTPDPVTISGNTFTNVDVEGTAREDKAGTRGLLQIPSKGDYTEADLILDGNDSENCGPILRQLNQGLADNGLENLSGDLAGLGGELTFTVDSATKENEEKPAQPTVYTVSFSGADVADMKVTSGTVITLPTPAKSGYTFKGWTLDGTPVTTATYEITADTTFTAVWESSSTGGSSYGSRINKKTEDVKDELDFADVSERDYYYDAVKWAAENGIASGVSSTRFGPGLDCTRGQTMTFLWRAMGEPEPDSLASSLTDVMSGSYYYKAVLWAMQEGVTTGMGKNVFAPDTTVTRGQFVTFLYRLAGASGSGEHPFTDVPAGSYSEAAIAWAYSEGITTGTSATTFSPDAPCTRAQIITFLYRYFGK